MCLCLFFRNGRIKGVLPVHVVVPTQGQEFKFEQLLVSAKEMLLQVDYKKNKKDSAYAKRKGCC